MLYEQLLALWPELRWTCPSDCSYTPHPPVCVRGDRKEGGRGGEGGRRGGGKERKEGGGRERKEG